MPNETVLLRSALVVALALSLAPARAIAEEGSEDAISDLRLEGSPLMGRDFRISGPETSMDPDVFGDTNQHGSAISLTQTVRWHTRVALSYYRGLSDLEADRGTFMGGLSAVQDRYSTQGHSAVTSRLVDLFGGFAWAFTPEWHVEEGIILGVGHSKAKFSFPSWYEDGSKFSTESDGLCYEYGARIGTYYTLWSHLQAGVDVRYMVTESDFHITSRHTNTTDGTVDTDDFRPTARIQGFGGMFSVGWRF